MRRVMLGMAVLAALGLVLSTPPTDAPAQGGAVSGAVKFAGPPAANPKIDMTEEPTCKAKHPQGAVDPVVVVNKGGLANVFLYVKSGLPAGGKYPTPTTPVVLDQTGCLYQPRVLGVMAGQPIEIRNSDQLLHNIKAVPKKNRPFNISQPMAGMKTTRNFPVPELAVPLECNVHGWMHAKVFVMDHPFFAVSGDDGSFSIKGLPAGTYTLEAWHEKFGAKTATVTVAAGGAGTASFTFGG
ncbi:MAG: carboxypeptidase regulatory-like domain-containing protein [Gemmatimonadetes bacterium]|nr:carboxypeptidase regulatory-like domain-containing protein [Gemmatimonadota bacterium]